MARAGDAELLDTGLAPRKLAAVRAAIELGVRVTSARRWPADHWTRDAVASFGPRLAMEPVEEFRAAVLDVRHRVTRELLIARASLTGVEVHPRDAFRELLRVGAAAVIFAHNHPSGDPSPSAQDIT
jgi:DNA repair protein RadC